MACFMGCGLRHPCRPVVCKAERAGTWRTSPMQPASSPTVSYPSDHRSATHLTLRTEVGEFGYLESGPKDGFPVMLLHGFPRRCAGVGRRRQGVRRAAVAVAAVLVAWLWAELHHGKGRAGWLLRRARTRRAGFRGQAGAERLLDRRAGLGRTRSVRGGGDRPRTAGRGWGSWRWARRTAIRRRRDRTTWRQVRLYWYQWFFQTEKGKAALEGDRHAMCEALWRAWSPHWQYAPEEFAATARSFANGQFVDTVLHSYRYRWHNAPPIPRYARQQILATEEAPIPVPVTFIGGADDHCTPRSCTDRTKSCSKGGTAGWRWQAAGTSCNARSRRKWPTRSWRTCNGGAYCQRSKLATLGLVTLVQGF